MRLFTKSQKPGEESIGAGGLNLLLSGFRRQDVVPIDAIVHCIDLVPSFRLEGLREIVYLPEYAQAAAAYSQRGMVCSEPKGEFVQRERRIFVYTFDHPAMFFDIEKHAFMRDCVFSGAPDTLKERVQGDSDREGLR